MTEADARAYVGTGEPMDMGSCNTARIAYRFPPLGASNHVESGSSGRPVRVGARNACGARCEAVAEVAGRSWIPSESGD